MSKFNLGKPPDNQILREPLVQYSKSSHRILVFVKMAVTTGMSFIVASISSVLVFSGMQMYKPWLSSSQLHTLLGGYLGSLLFVLCLTAVGNLETCVFGKSFQVKIFEVLTCLLLAVFTSATVHRVCATSCLILSLCALFYVNKYSQRIHAIPAPSVPVQTGKKKKNVS